MSSLLTKFTSPHRHHLFNYLLQHHVRSLSHLPSQTPPKPSQAPNHRSLTPLAYLFQNHAFPQSQLHEFLRKNRFLWSFDVADVERSLGILSSFNLPQKSILSIISDCPSVLELGFLRNWESGFQGLGFSRVSPMLVHSVLLHCRRFNVGPNEVNCSLSMLRNLGFSDESVTRVFEEFPCVITMRSCDIDRKLGFLRGLGIGLEEIDRICCCFPRVLGIGDGLKELFNEFKDLGFSNNEIRREIVENPRILSMEVGELLRFLQLLRNLKCRLSIKERILSMGEFRAGFEAKLRVDCLCRYGLIRRDALNVLKREPRLVLYALKDIEKKIEFLVHKMGFRIGCIVEVPEYLGVSFEKQIVPRFGVIDHLRSNGGLGSEVGLRDLIKLSRLRFYNLYVKPYPECEKMFPKFVESSRLRDRPVGLWKMFKPKSYPQTKEDLQNMKLFMEYAV
ncbi:hypothetical protein Sjap_001458 [Stephania japonica]|uniref:Transcription termination factor MTERF15, mitochondrial n=1 Tax=Stephania japonica TaxID=461633 RepID=A0AAP0KLH6_9MAGN